MQVQQYAACSRALLNPRKARLRAEVKMGQHLALERAVLLAKLIVNLHYYAEGRCAAQLKVGGAGEGGGMFWQGEMCCTALKAQENVLPCGEL